MEQDNTGGIKILRTTTIARDKWLGFMSRDFVGRDGQEHSWSFVERNAKRSAVVVIARTRTSNKIVLIKQFRIPLARWIYEFPAGLVDEGESLETAAGRELLEETGFSGEVLSVSPPLPTSAGLCSEFIHLVTIRCNDSAGAHAREAAEAIELALIPDSPTGIQEFLAQAAAEGTAVDAKLFSWLQGRIDAAEA